jgi:hypothetical protein
LVSSHQNTLSQTKALIASLICAENVEQAAAPCVQRARLKSQEIRSVVSTSIVSCSKYGHFLEITSMMYANVCVLLVLFEPLAQETEGMMSTAFVLSKCQKND